MLCFGAGATDILSYLTLGKIFTSAMTGCAALLFVGATGGHYPVAIRAALALASYMAGCGLAVALQPADEKQVKTPFTLRRLLLAECILLGIYCLVSVHVHEPAAGAPRLWMIAMSATAMGLQSIVAQDLSEPGISTVVLNPTMTSLGVAATKVFLRREAKLPRPNRLQIVVLMTYAVGALLTAIGVSAHVVETNFLPFVAALIVLALTQAQCRSQAREPQHA
jgi:uncharacterized membrane protein YoaK (UPF0700 family)